MNINSEEIILFPTKVADLEALFEFQLDEESRLLAAFMPKHPTNKALYLGKYTGLLKEQTVNMQTIFLENSIIGSISKFEMEGNAEITYWIDKRFWGKGIATAALGRFLAIEPLRPIFGRVAFDNIGSQAVLEKNGFVRIGEDKGFANARKKEITEFIYKLSN